MTSRSKTVALTRNAGAMITVDVYPGLFDLTDKTTPDGCYIYYSRQSPSRSSGLSASSAYQSIGYPISLSAELTLKGVDNFDRAEIDWYVSNSTDYAAGEKIATHTYPDLVQTYEEAMKGLNTSDLKDLIQRRRRFNQLINEHVDLPAKYAESTSAFLVTAVVKTYCTGADYCYTDTSSFWVQTLAQNEDLFEVDESGIVTAYIGCEDTITFPQEKDGRTVTGIGHLSGLTDRDRKYKAYARTLVIPEGYTNIADYAFNRMASIEHIELPSTMESIGKYAFYETNLQNDLTLPAALESIGAWAFYAVPVSTLTFHPDKFPTLGTRAFSACEKLTTVTFPANASGSFAASFVGTDTFTYCKLFRSIQNPSAITDMDPTTEEGKTNINKHFYNSPVVAQLLAGQVDDTKFSYRKTDGGWAVASVLELNDAGSIVFPASYQGEPVVAIGVDSPLFDEAAGIDPAAVTAITIPNTVESIGANAFTMCVNLASVTFPESVKKIDEAAFSDCRQLRRVLTFTPGTEIGKRAFQGCWRVSEITVDGCSISHEAFDKCITLKTVNGAWTPDFGVDYPEAAGSKSGVEYQAFPFTQVSPNFMNTSIIP